MPLTFLFSLIISYISCLACLMLMEKRKIIHFENFITRHYFNGFILTPIVAIVAAILYSIITNFPIYISYWNKIVKFAYAIS